MDIDAAPMVSEQCIVKPPVTSSGLQQKLDSAAGCHPNMVGVPHDAQSSADKQAPTKHCVQGVAASEAKGQQHSGDPSQGADSKCAAAFKAGKEHRVREPTPEGLANLGKAVDLVQASSCQLSPSLLTVGHDANGLDSPARNAFERGRASPL